MILKDILAISGEHGLFRFVAQGKNAIVIEHLETKKRMSAFASAKVSSLDEIAIFTVSEDVPLGKLFDIIWEKSSGGQAPDYKSAPEVLKKWFVEVLPGYDKDRVYVSDMKKVAQWYNTLHSLNMLVKEEEKKEEHAEEQKNEAPVTEEVKVPKKRSPKKKPE